MISYLNEKVNRMFEELDCYGEEAKVQGEQI